jgi:hypothetical protein
MPDIHRQAQANTDQWHSDATGEAAALAPQPDMTSSRLSGKRSRARCPPDAWGAVPAVAAPAQPHTDREEALIALVKQLGRQAAREDLAARNSTVPRTLEEGL